MSEASSREVSVRSQAIRQLIHRDGIGSADHLREIIGSGRLGEGETARLKRLSAIAGLATDETTTS